jgi:hypothetical protein
MRNATTIACFLGTTVEASHACTGEGVLWLNGKALDRERHEGEFVCEPCWDVFFAISEASVLEWTEEDAEAHEGSAGTAAREGTHSTFVNSAEVEFYGLWDLVG